MLINSRPLTTSPRPHAVKTRHSWRETACRAPSGQAMRNINVIGLLNERLKNPFRFITFPHCLESDSGNDLQKEIANFGKGNERLKWIT
ncbi:hypothetical protein HC231_14865 [Brenneria izadpanahii]|uniref:Uncharacterized protein n=1 Tax=Brenneria izadpanahii TaxID=2722756 RepID=A0ABX7UTE2_9GAMM|nr:hypothetical protein [Brenneria izadpanahii]QTF09044.1 hypothetical protein HC231_14865 [Brenneria izadpanahii]